MPDSVESESIPFLIQTRSIDLRVTAANFLIRWQEEFGRDLPPELSCYQRDLQMAFLAGCAHGARQAAELHKQLREELLKEVPPPRNVKGGTLAKSRPSLTMQPRNQSMEAVPCDSRI